MLKMQVSMYIDDDSDSIPLECSVEDHRADALEHLKDRVDGIVISTLMDNNVRSGDYLVEVSFEENGEYLDHEEPTGCYCDIEAGTVTWRWDE